MHCVMIPILVCAWKLSTCLVRSLEETPNVVLMPDPQSTDGMGGPMMQAGAPGVSNNGSIESVVRELESLQRNNTDRYVRLRSASALRELSARSDQ